MNTEEQVMMSYFGDFEKALMHYGVLRKSGRYPWGSGDTPYQRHKSFLATVDDLIKNKGMSEAEVAKALLGEKASSSDIRALRSIASNAKRAADISQARRLSESGMSNVAIGREMGVNESTVRSLLNPTSEARNGVLQNTADYLKAQVDKGGYVDVGAGTEHYLNGISPDKKNVAIKMLEEEGYKTFYVPVEQVGTGKTTNIKVLAKPDATFPEVVKNQDQIKTLTGYSEDGGRTIREIVAPKHMDADRVGVRYGEDGGSAKDGVIELRRGVDDISLGGAQYAQVRIGVNGTHYLKGMAMYSDNLPDGVDMVFNTNKSKTGNKLDSMKAIKDDSELPFGSIVTQRTYLDKSGKRQLSPINIVGDENSMNSEGRWDQWSRTLSSQMLSKQSPALAKQQLDLAYQIRRQEYDEIMSLTNPTVRRKLLQEFADGSDAASVHLKAAALPRTRNQVILPINSLKDNEVYAPNFKNGETVVLIRHPHGGTFEIPELKVNNRNREALSVIKQARDAVGINSRVAQRLSGADFDGDTVLVIPNNSGKIKSTAPLAKLKNFDTQTAYPGYEGMKVMTPKGKQRAMGDISNLITDMTIRGASHNEIARAVAHSMVVIDAEKHKLNYKQSAIDNGIAELKQKYQGNSKGGSATLISRANSPVRVGERSLRSAKDGGPIDPKTGEKIWVYSNETYKDQKVNKRTGVVTEETVRKLSRVKSTRMAEARDAFDLVSSPSGTPMEAVYATHANRLKALANNARKATLDYKPIPMSPTAKKTYFKEVESLNLKLKKAQMNAPLERKAQLIANSQVSQRRKANPDIDTDEVKKIKAQELDKARARTGAKKERIEFTPTEWQAVQAGAISSSKLSSMLDNANMDSVRELATPRTRTVMTDAKLRRAQSMLSSGYTQAEIAETLGVPTSTLNDAIS